MPRETFDFRVIPGYAIKAERYYEVEHELRNDELSHEELLQLGAFRINDALKPEDVIQHAKGKPVDDLTMDDIIYVHQGWLEMAVGKNKATPEEYLDAAKLLARYVSEAEKRGVFRENEIGTIMNLFVKSFVPGYTLCPWVISTVDDTRFTDGSKITSVDSFFSDERSALFLKTREPSDDGSAHVPKLYRVLAATIGYIPGVVHEKWMHQLDLFSVGDPPMMPYFIDKGDPHLKKNMVAEILKAAADKFIPSTLMEGLQSDLERVYRGCQNV